MWLRSLQADRLRNLRAVRLTLEPRVTVLAGRNGHGKSTLLESVYLLATGHSFRTRRLEELVAREGGPSSVHGDVEGMASHRALRVVIDQGRRELAVGGISQDLDGFLGCLDLVALTGDDVRALRDGPPSRRRFLDRGIAGCDAAYLRETAANRRALAERNALLKRSRSGEAGPTALEMEVWEERLAAAAARIHRRRRAYVLRIASRLGPIERALFPEGGTIRLRYVPSPISAAEAEASEFGDLYRRSLSASRRRDVGLGFTVEGPHRDDLVVELDGWDLRTYGSAGQLRAALVALAAAQLEVLREERRETPLFLMDDFDSDLDEIRVDSLLEFLRGGGFQALLATSKDAVVDRLGAGISLVRVESGTARAL